MGWGNPVQHSMCSMALFPTGDQPAENAPKGVSQFPSRKQLASRLYAQFSIYNCHIFLTPIYFPHIFNIFLTTETRWTVGFYPDLSPQETVPKVNTSRKFSYLRGNFTQNLPSTFNGLFLLGCASTGEVVHSPPFIPNPYKTVYSMYMCIYIYICSTI